MSLHVLSVNQESYPKIRIIEEVGGANLDLCGTRSYDSSDGDRGGTK